MNITLVFPPFFHEAMYNLPPLGLVNLATTLAETSHTVSVLDQVLALRTDELAMGVNIYRDAADQILATDPDLVGFSAQCTTYPPIVQIAQRLKQARPDLRIVIGGHNATFLAKQTLQRFACIDLVIRGEGEITFPKLVAALATGRDLEHIAGLTWRKNGTVISNPDRPLIPDLDTLPLPNYALVPSLETYRQACALPRSIAILEVGRGCPHDCVYCSEAALWQRRTRTYSIPRVIREMQTLRDQYGADCFLLTYDQFTADRRYVETFCHAVLDAGLQTTPWYCISRLDTVDAGILGLMREAGCESMCYGIDSGSERTLAFIRKRIDRDILFTRVRETTDVGLVPTLSFVIGFPKEQISDIDETLTLALQCGIQGNSNPLMQMPTVLPGTDLHKRYHAQLVREVDTYFALGLEFDAGVRLQDDERLIEADPEIFSSFCNLPCPAMPLADLNRISCGFPLIVNLFPKSFLLLCRAFGASPSQFYLQFADRVAAAERALPELDAPACFRYFPDFTRDKLRNLAAVPDWTHLADVLAYEIAALEVAEFANAWKPGNIDLSRLQSLRPQRPRNTKVAGFRHDLPTIIADLKAGIERHSYPEQPCWLVFRQTGRELEVTEINSFGRDMLERCTGEVSLAEIAAELQPIHGATMTAEEFLAACQEAATELTRLELLADVQTEAPETREVKHVEDP